MATVEAEGHPARLFAQGDARQLFGRQGRDVKDMNAAVGRVAHPGLALVGCQADSMTWTTVPFCQSLLEALHLGAAQQLAGCRVADLKTQQAVDVDEAA